MRRLQDAPADVLADPAAMLGQAGAAGGNGTEDVDAQPFDIAEVHEAHTVGTEGPPAQVQPRELASLRQCVAHLSR